MSSDKITPKLFLWNGLALIIADLQHTAVHSHHAIQLTGSTSEPFTIEFPGKEKVSTNTIAIQSNEPHKFLNPSEEAVIFLCIEPHSRLGEMVQTGILWDQPYKNLDKSLLASLLTGIDENRFDCSQMYRKVKGLVQEISGKNSNELQMDNRVQKAMAYIKDHLDRKITIKELACHVHLSESRLMHLIKQETGMPFRKHVLWALLRVCTQNIIEGMNLTQAAVEAGFADQAHFSRTFLAMFGIPPADFFKDSRNIQAVFCDGI